MACIHVMKICIDSILIPESTVNKKMFSSNWLSFNTLAALVLTLKTISVSSSTSCFAVFASVINK